MPRGVRLRVKFDVTVMTTAKETQEIIPANDSRMLARQVVTAMNGAFKKILLYPAEHIIYHNALESLKNKLDTFFAKHSSLVLTIDQNKLCYDGEVIHEGPMNEENPAYIFFRDGIYLLEFQKSMDAWEIHSFLEILQKNQMLSEDAENDTVTALWEAGLPSVRYEAEDVGFDTGEDFEIPELGDFETAEETPDQPEADSDQAQSPSDDPSRVHDWNLQEITAQDREHLHNMLVEEETWERIEYVIYILLYILQQQTQPDDFSEVMVFLNHELQDGMREHKYQSVYKTLQILRKNIDIQKDRDHWSIPILKEFFASLSEKAFLNVLRDDQHQIAACSPQDFDFLKRTLLLLDASAVEALGPMLLEAEPKRFKNLLMTVIGVLGEREFAGMEKLLSSPDAALIKTLIHIMGFMKSDLSLKQLKKFLRDASADIRKEALKAVFRRDSDCISDMAWLLEDPDEDVRKIFLRYLGQQRSLKVERLLREHLAKNRIRAGNKHLLFDVYISLGKCGSDESLPFLKKKLFYFPALGILRPKRSLCRQAAVHALKALNTEKARSLLDGRNQ